VIECPLSSVYANALITGGNTGLGAAFARRLAADGHDLVLVARDRERLEKTAGELRAVHGVRVEILRADLTVSEERALVEQRLAEGPAPVDVLVNNAAVIVRELFDEAPMEALQEELDINVTAVLRLTRAALPGMLARRRGAVVNVASYLPPAGWSYAAGKAWVLSFTDTIAASLGGTGVRVIALAPGAVPTGHHERNGVPTSRSTLWLEPGVVVDRCLTDLAHGHAVCVPGPAYRLVVDVLELPSRALRVLSRLARRNRERGVSRDASKATISPADSATSLRFGHGPNLPR
jgi:short-subunit dehydrogenase